MYIHRYQKITNWIVIILLLFVIVFLGNIQTLQHSNSKKMDTLLNNIDNLHTDVTKVLD